MTLSEFLKQPSTIRGIIFFIGLTAYKISPENVADILYFIGNIFAVHETFRNESVKVQNG